MANKKKDLELKALAEAITDFEETEEKEARKEDQLEAEDLILFSALFTDFVNEVADLEEQGKDSYYKELQKAYSESHKLPLQAPLTLMFTAFSAGVLQGLALKAETDKATRKNNGAERQ